MEVNQNIISLNIINIVLEKIIRSLEDDSLTSVDPLFNINSYFSKIDLKKEIIPDKYRFKQLAETVLTMSEKLPENNKSNEFKRNVSTLLNSLDI